MQTEIIFAGFGGQGVLTAGKFLAQAGMDEGQQVCWMPSYGPEMRGGTANCTVVLSDRRIGSPIVASPAAAICMNLPALDKFEPTVRKGGLVILNSSLIERAAKREDVDVLRIPANEIAIGLGNAKVANMVILGALLGKLSLVKMDTVEALVRSTFGVKKPKLVEINVQALEAGRKLAATGAGKA